MKNFRQFLLESPSQKLAGFSHEQFEQIMRPIAGGDDPNHPLRLKRKQALIDFPNEMDIRAQQQDPRGYRARQNAGSSSSQQDATQQANREAEQRRKTREAQAKQEREAKARQYQEDARNAPPTRVFGGVYFPPPAKGLKPVQDTQDYWVKPSTVDYLNDLATKTYDNQEDVNRHWDRVDFWLDRSNNSWVKHVNAKQNAHKSSGMGLDPERWDFWGTSRPTRTFKNTAGDWRHEFSGESYKPIENNWRTMERAFPNNGTSPTPATNLWLGQLKLVQHPNIRTDTLMGVLSGGRHTHPQVAISAIHQLIQRKDDVNEDSEGNPWSRSERENVPHKVAGFFAEHPHLSDRFRKKYGGTPLMKEVVDEYGTHPKVEEAIDQLHAAYGAIRTD